jgi:CheY-like chemotaxis protein
MPGMDGREVAAKLRSTEALKTKPIIFVSATVSKHDGMATRIAGFPAIQKPLGMDELVQLVDASCPARLRGKKPSQRRRQSRRAAYRRGVEKPNLKQDNKLKALIAQVVECISGSGGTLTPICETKILNVNQSLRILSMLESWTYAPSKVLHVKIDRTEPDLATVATVSVNDGSGRAFDESQTDELLAHIREQVVVLTA